MSKEKIITSVDQIFSVNYASSSSLITPQISIDCDRNAIKVDYSSLVIIKGESSSDNGYILNNIPTTSIPQCYVKENNSIVWDTIYPTTNLDIPSSFTMVMRIKAQETFDGNIFEMTDVNDKKYNLRIENERFYYKIGHYNNNIEFGPIDIYNIFADGKTQVGSSANLIKLDSTASSILDYYKGKYLTIKNETRLITAYDGTTQTATLSTITQASAVFTTTTVVITETVLTFAIGNEIYITGSSISANNKTATIINASNNGTQSIYTFATSTFITGTSTTIITMGTTGLSSIPSSGQYYIISNILPVIGLSNSSSTPISRQRYEWQDNMIWDDTKYFLFNNDFVDYWWNIYVYKNGIIFYLDNGSGVVINAIQTLGNYDVNYKSIKIFGNINYNFVSVYKTTLIESERTEINSKHSYAPTLDGSMYLLANFDENNIDASNTNTVNGLLTKYNVYRENKTDESFKKIAEPTSSQKIIYDYAVNLQNEYKYHITPVYEEFVTLKTLLGVPIETDKIIPNWYNYSIIGTKSNFNINKNNIYEVDGDNIWIFSLNVENGDINITTDKTIYDGLSTYAKVNQGLKNYKTGSVTMMLGKFGSTGI